VGSTTQQVYPQDPSATSAIGGDPRKHREVQRIIGCPAHIASFAMGATAPPENLVTRTCDVCPFLPWVKFHRIPSKDERGWCVQGQPAHPRSLIERVIVPSSRSRLFTTSKTAEALHPAKISDNFLFWKTLPATLTRSRLCRATFKMTQCFQDFPRYRGRGVFPRLHLIRCNPKCAGKITNQQTYHCGFRAVIGCPIPASVAGVGILPCPADAMARNLRVRAALAIIGSLQSVLQSSYPISGRTLCRQM